MIGTGYVGLVTGTCLAEVGNDVLCLDTDARKIDDPERRAACRSTNPDSSRRSARNVAAGRLRFTTDVDASVAHGALQFIAVGTPPDEDGSADMQYVIAAARAIGRRMTERKDHRRQIDSSRSAPPIACMRRSPRNWLRAASKCRLPSRPTRNS